MTGDENAERIALLAEAAAVAWAELTLALRDLCPEREKHKFVQHRDHSGPGARIAGIPSGESK